MRFIPGTRNAITGAAPRQRPDSSRGSARAASEIEQQSGLPALNSILQLPVFRTGELVSGSTQLHRPVTWVHVAEVMDVWRFLTGGEFLLSTGLEIARATTDQRVNYLRSLIRAGASGLGIELVHSLQQLPDEMQAAAEEADFPLVVFRSEVSFASLTRAAHERILRPRHERQEEPALAPLLDALIETGRDRIFLEGQLGPVLRLPRRPRTVLLGTLEALIEAQYNIAETARRLAVRRQSIYYRLAQLNSLLGSLEDPQRKVGFLIAIALLRRNPPA